MKWLQPEVLAPAGSYEIMLRAFQAGADAVYLGGHQFGARAYASNFSEQELIQAIEYAACHHKQIYLTVNTLLKDEEIDRLSVYLKAPYEAGLDGVIVQDLGVLDHIRSEFPRLEIHASTQMTITDAASACMLKSLGVTRVVPARELSMEELTALKRESDMEIEVFVHGALCYCYSGQCLMSSMIGGRSGNRGTCAQPCRQLYTLLDCENRKPVLGEKYLLSPSDLCGLSAIPELMFAGVDSLKIEGRMKNAEYVVSATEAYRKAVDICMEILTKNGSFETDALKSIWTAKDQAEYDRFVMTEKNRLADIFNRGGFTDGYYHQYHGKTMMSMERNHHNGLMIGVVRRVSGGTFDVVLAHVLHKGDILELRPNASEVIELTSGTSGNKGDIVILNGKQMRSIAAGMAVYRTKNTTLGQELISENSEKQMKENIHISVMCKKDLPVTITMSCSENSVTVSGERVQAAMKQPVTQKDLEKKLQKIGEYPFEINMIDWKIDPDIFVSMKEFNHLRRQAMEELYRECCKRKCRIPESGVQSEDVRKESLISDNGQTEQTAVDRTKIRHTHVLQPKLAVYISEEAQLETVLSGGKASVIGLETEYFSVEQMRDMIARIAGSVSVMIALPHIYRQNMKLALQEMLSLQVDGYLVRTLDELCITEDYIRQNHADRQIILDAGVYTYNRRTIEYMQKEHAIEAFTLSAEYDRDDLRNLLQLPVPTKREWVIYGHQMVMVSAQCVYLNTDVCRKEQDSKKQYSITNAHKDEFVIEPICKYCYNVIYQAVPTALFDKLPDMRNTPPDTLRIHLLHENRDEIEDLLTYRIRTEYGLGRYLKGI